MLLARSTCPQLFTPIVAPPCPTPAAGSLAAAYPLEPHELAGPSAVQHACSLERYLERQPLPPHTHDAFGELTAWLDAAGERPLILDSGCGTGLSTRALALAHPQSLVLGVDRSGDRLGRRLGPHKTGKDAVPPNALLLRAELATLWRMLQISGRRVGSRFQQLLPPSPSARPSHPVMFGSQITTCCSTPTRTRSHASAAGGGTFTPRSHSCWRSVAR